MTDPFVSSIEGLDVVMTRINEATWAKFVDRKAEGAGFKLPMYDANCFRYDANCFRFGETLTFEVIDMDIETLMLATGIDLRQPICRIDPDDYHARGSE